jgi:hypothetical protein
MIFSVGQSTFSPQSTAAQFLQNSEGNRAGNQNRKKANW